jgi:hypothetical protein
MNMIKKKIAPIAPWAFAPFAPWAPRKASVTKLRVALLELRYLPEKSPAGLIYLNLA